MVDALVIVPLIIVGAAVGAFVFLGGTQRQLTEITTEVAAITDGRAQRRIVPKNPHSTLIFGDGTTLNCLVIDVSPSGVAVSADVEPEIGMRLAVGRCVGTVVRQFPEGFAVQFDFLQPIEALEHMMTPPKDLSAYVQRSGLASAAVPGASPQRAEHWYVS